MDLHNRYMMRGVSAAKEDVHNAIKNIDKGIFPQAFCKIIPDILGGDPEYCNIMHADGAGTKSSLAYMYWKETGDLSVWILLFCLRISCFFLASLRSSLCPISLSPLRSICVFIYKSLKKCHDQYLKVQS